MKKLAVIMALLFLPFFCYPDSKKPQVIFFHSSHCNACISLQRSLLPALKHKYKDKLAWLELDIYENPNNLALLHSVAARFKKSASVPAVLVGDILLIGKEDIAQNLDGQISLVLKKAPKFLEFVRIDLKQLFNQLSAFTVMGLGLIDGVNPCAFAVIVFFVSFLAVYGYKKREIVIVGASYCFAVFLTYLLLGLGTFKFLYSLKEMQVLIKAFYYVVAGLCFFLAACAAWDYFKFKKTGTSSEMILQLPAFLKKRINVVIGSGLRSKGERGVIGLSITSFSIGFLVSILEAACTGQVYVPTIVFILKNTEMKLKAFSYLILYNLMFILPLLVIFVLSLAGVSSHRFNDFLKGNLGRIKIVMAVGFFLLGIFILVIS